MGMSMRMPKLMSKHMTGRTRVESNDALMKRLNRKTGGGLKSQGTSATGRHGQWGRCVHMRADTCMDPCTGVGMEMRMEICVGMCL